MMDGSDVGKDGTPYFSSAGIALEPQGYPDAVHWANFPSILLDVGEEYTFRAVYQFFISARILSLASSTFMRERIKVMMASSTKGITRYMSFSILMQDSGCTASALS